MTVTCEVGSSKLWLGQPLLVSSVPGAHHFLTGVDSTGVQRPTRISANLPPGVAAFETLDLAPGAYELTVEHAGNKAALPEFIWLLTRADYRATALAESSENFGLEPIVSNTAELTHLLNNDIAALWPTIANPFTISWSKDDNAVLYAPINWSVDTVLRSLKCLSAFEMTNLAGFISIAGHRVEISLDAKFKYAIPGVISASFYDKECSDIYLLNANGDLGEFEADIDVSNRRAHIAVRQPVPELEFA